MYREHAPVIAAGMREDPETRRMMFKLNPHGCPDAKARPGYCCPAHVACASLTQCQRAADARRVARIREDMLESAFAAGGARHPEAY